MANKCLDYEFLKEGEDSVLRFDCEECPFFPSIEDNETSMAAVLDALIENPSATRIVLSQKRDYEYDYEQTRMLREIAVIQSQLSRQKPVFATSKSTLFVRLKNIFYQKMKSDPLAAYYELKTLYKSEQTKKDNASLMAAAFLGRAVKLIESSKLISLAREFPYKYGERSIYRKVLRQSIKPDFMFTRLMSSFPIDGEEIDSYTVNDTGVTIFRLPNTVQKLYHIIPPEFKLSEDNYELLDEARNIISEHKPEKSEFIDPERMRQVFFNVGNDLIDELSESKGIRLRSKEIEELANILVRYTIGFGLVEVLLQDEKVQDITINSPMGRMPAFIVHQEYDDCITNIVPTSNEGESWATKLRLLSGRPLDEANPILDTELVLPKARARVAAITSPLNPSGIAYAFRRHRDRPWTLPLFIKNRMITTAAAGLISFLIDGSRTMLVAGTRSAGKTSFLGALMTEVMRKYRLITIEDTLELPVASLKKLNYNIQSLKVAGALTTGTEEASADEGIRSTLRLGDSGLIVGEVRSVEARALYEAMRVGALANVVAGTIHGESPYGVFDRVVNDLGVPRTSFKATDVIIVANPIKSPDGLHRQRRVVQITEVGKLWEQDPLAEKGFTDLMKYDAASDMLETTPELMNGDSEVLKSIASNVKEWAGSWDAVWDNIMLRAKVKEAIVSASEKAKMPELLEAGFVVAANDQFHRISDEVKSEIDYLDNKRIFFNWNEWLRKKLKGNVQAAYSQLD
ncbi:type II/IV secretion system ATPase subunit [Candidatus Woesearchaeota archaeon]|nr:type II/IV secretion system ATPase subunit [Candidatus Woesearchaeota archaeon]